MCSVFFNVHLVLLFSTLDDLHLTSYPRDKICVWHGAIMNSWGGGGEEKRTRPYTIHRWQTRSYCTVLRSLRSKSGHKLQVSALVSLMVTGIYNTRIIQPSSTHGYLIIMFSMHLLSVTIQIVTHNLIWLSR